VEWARRAADRAPDATLVEIPACGHWPTHEHPAVVVDALSEFFAT
jgi:pimeloyl-ACP methyl ester carboxylesterase